MLRKTSKYFYKHFTKNIKCNFVYKLIFSYYNSFLSLSLRYILILYILVKFTVNDPKEWVKCEDPICVATAMYDFMAVSNEELSLRTGQKIWLAPRSLQSKSIPGWWIATDNRNVGLVPANYVTIVGQLKRKPESENNGNVITSTVIPTSMQNTIASEQINTVEPNIDQQNTDFSENNIKDDLF